MINHCALGSVWLTFLSAFNLFMHETHDEKKMLNNNLLALLCMMLFLSQPLLVIKLVIVNSFVLYVVGSNVGHNKCPVQENIITSLLLYR